MVLNLVIRLLRLSRTFSATLTWRFGEDGCGRKMVGTEKLILTQHSPYLWYETYHVVMVWGNFWKKPTPGQAAPGLEPWTSRMQSGALSAWPQCSVYVSSCKYGIYNTEPQCLFIPPWIISLTALLCFPPIIFHFFRRAATTTTHTEY
jgi:hypothetical protein